MIRYLFLSNGTPGASLSGSVTYSQVTMGKVNLYTAGVAAKITHAAFRPSSIKDLSFARHTLPRNTNVSGLLGKQRPG